MFLPQLCRSTLQSLLWPSSIPVMKSSRCSSRCCHFIYSYLSIWLPNFLKNDATPTIFLSVLKPSVIWILPQWLFETALSKILRSWLLNPLGFYHFLNITDLPPFYTSPHPGFNKLFPFTSSSDLLKWNLEMLFPCSSHWPQHWIQTLNVVYGIYFYLVD